MRAHGGSRVRVNDKWTASANRFIEMAEPPLVGTRYGREARAFSCPAVARPRPISSVHTVAGQRVFHAGIPSPFGFYFGSSLVISTVARPAHISPSFAIFHPPSPFLRRLPRPRSHLPKKLIGLLCIVEVGRICVPTTGLKCPTLEHFTVFR